jgi:N utilization substance protein A
MLLAEIPAACWVFPCTTHYSIMASEDILRYIDTLARDKEIDKEGLFDSIEFAVAAALSKKYGIEDLEITIDRESGQWVSNYEIALESEGRILAQAVKQSINVKVREAERDRLYEEFEMKIGEIVNGTVQRFEGDTVIVNLGNNMEGILPRAEKVRGEVYNIGDRIRAMVLEVKKVGTRVKVILTRGHRDLVRCLFELEVPEIADGIIDIRRIEREPGYRTKLAVHSTDDKVDCVGACVGVRGTRIKSIIDELGGERIDIIRWSTEPDMLIANALKPAEVSHIELEPSTRKALVLVDEDQLSLAIGRKGQNVRLASKLSLWDIDIMTRAELEESMVTDAKSEDGETEEGSEGDTPDTASTDANSEVTDSAGTDSTEPGSAGDSADTANPEEASTDTTTTPEPTAVAAAEGAGTESSSDTETDPAAPKADG